MKFKVDGNEYEFPSLDTLTMDEAIILERYAGANISEMFPGESLPMGALKGMIVISVMRERPDTSEREISEAIGKIKFSEMDSLVMPDAEADASPPDSTPSESVGDTETSGDDGSESTESSPAAVLPLSSGNQGSGTGVTSGLKTSAG